MGVHGDRLLIHSSYTTPWDTIRNETGEGDQGRIETTATTTIHDVEWLKERHDWPGLQSIVIVDSTWDTAGKIEQETRLNITSSNLPAERMGPIVRSHWAVQNSLHGVVDRVFRDAAGRLRTAKTPPANVTTLTQMAHNLFPRPKPATPCASDAKSPLGTTNSSQASASLNPSPNFPGSAW